MDQNPGDRLPQVVTIKDAEQPVDSRLGVLLTRKAIRQRDHPSACNTFPERHDSRRAGPKAQLR